MKRIAKNSEPFALSQWKIGNRNATYGDMPEALRIEVRRSCAAEQLYICAYCCSFISGDRPDTMNEHVKSRRNYPALQLDYANIVASCTTRNQCDDAHGSTDFDLTPLMDECEEELSYMASGGIRGETPRAERTITALNLGRNIRENRRLVESRRASIMGFIFSQGLELTDVANDPEFREILLGELDTVHDGQLTPYAPVIASVIRAFT